MFIVGFQQIQDPYYHGFAAQISFYLMLSVVPILILIIQLLRLCGYTLSLGNNFHGFPKKILFSYPESGLKNSL